jgi:hypothetical protein
LSADRPDITLVNPPLTQLNTPYPAISYLARALRSAGHTVAQRDLGIELALRLLSSDGLTEVFTEIESSEALPEPAWRSLSLAQAYIDTIEPVIAFLQGKDRGLANRIRNTPFLPRGPRLQNANLDHFGRMGSHDAARYLATLYIEDLVDLITATIDPGFSLTRYQHNLAVGSTSFDPIWARLKQTNLVDKHLDDLADSIDSELVGLSVAFPGNLYGALRIGRRLKARGVTVIMGGGYVNTELRDLDEPRIWACVDQITYDDGEGPLLAILSLFKGGDDHRYRTRTSAGLLEHAHIPSPTVFSADYSGLALDPYLQLIDAHNPTSRLWSDGRWNKITLAHGCYWKKCAFCDVSLDYISRYERANIAMLVDQMVETIALTGEHGFHFVDEAAPPRLLKELALEILRRGISVSLWGNIRFEKSFTPDLCRLLAHAGVIAVTGGLEVANNRLLKKINKGVTVEDAARCAHAFQEVGIQVHAYLMYGFPGQTAQETVDGMEVVRQLFATGVLDSAFWHRFVLTRHAPIALAPEEYQVEILATEGSFSKNDLPHRDGLADVHDLFDEPLPRALNAWMSGSLQDEKVNEWLPTGLPTPTIDKAHIANTISKEMAYSGERLCWVGGIPLHGEGHLMIHTNTGVLLIDGPPEQLNWFDEVLASVSVGSENTITEEDTIKSCPEAWHQYAENWSILRNAGLLLL